MDYFKKMERQDPLRERLESVKKNLKRKAVTLSRFQEIMSFTQASETLKEK